MTADTLPVDAVPRPGDGFIILIDGVPHIGTEPAAQRAAGPLDVTAQLLAKFDPAELRGPDGKWTLGGLGKMIHSLKQGQMISHSGHEIDRNASGYNVRLYKREGGKKVRIGSQRYDTPEQAARAAFEGKHHTPGAEPKPPEPPKPPAAKPSGPRSVDAILNDWVKQGGSGKLPAGEKQAVADHIAKNGVQVPKGLVRGESDQPASRYKPGAVISLNPASFSRGDESALPYAEAGEGGVLLRVTSSDGLKGIDVSDKASAEGFEEQEWITSGNFKVTRVTTDSEGMKNVWVTPVKGSQRAAPAVKAPPAAWSPEKAAQVWKDLGSGTRGYLNPRERKDLERARGILFADKSERERQLGMTHEQAASIAATMNSGKGPGNSSLGNSVKSGAVLWTYEGDHSGESAVQGNPVDTARFKMAVDNAPVADKQLWRGLGGENTYSKPENFKALQAMAASKPGDVITTSRYASWSDKQSIATGFASIPQFPQQPGGKIQKVSILMRIQPGGTRALSIKGSLTGSPDATHFAYQNEWVTPAGIKYEVISNEPLSNGNGARMITVREVPA